jgi:hypothetical protein
VSGDGQLIGEGERDCKYGAVREVALGDSMERRGTSLGGEVRLWRHVTT